jgi:sugar lactone lactonase YvrE
VTDGFQENTALTRRGLMTTGATTLGVAVASVAQAQVRPAPAAGKPPATPIGRMDLHVAARAPNTPTGVVISATGRVFVFMPRFDDKTVYTVGEVARDGGVTPYPDAALNRPDAARAEQTLFFVPNGVIDARNRLWLVDAGLMASSGVPVPGAAKLVCIDLASNAVVRRIPLASAIEPTSSLNDLRVDAEARYAYVSDMGQEGQGAIIIVDLTTGRAVRRLGRHASAAWTPGIVKLVEGRQVMTRRPDGSTAPVKGGANGIALSPDGRRLYYSPLIGRHLYAIDTAILRDPQASDSAIAAKVEDLGEKGLTGGLLCDPQGRVLLTLQEHNAVGRRNADGSVEIIASDPRLVWSDTLWIEGGWLYVIAAQVNRRAEFNGGVDRQQRPWAILRTRLPA